MSAMLNTFIKVASIAILPIGLFGAIAPAQATVTQTCMIGEPKLGKPSPLAARASFSLEEQDGKMVTVKYSAASSQMNSKQPTVFSSTVQILTFTDSNVAAVRARMLKDSSYFKALTGFPEDNSFKPFNDALVCKGSDVVSSTIDVLPDGDYRFWSGPASNTVTDKDILATGEGGAVFLFSKEGKTIVGHFARANDFAMCINGTIANGKVTGAVSPVDRLALGAYPSDDSSYGPVGHLKFGKWKGPNRSGAYQGSTIDLTKFNPINIGARKAPTGCK
jgi:hypothetical protein